MNQPITLCLIGAGNHATQHIYPCLSQLKGARVLANADLDEAKARQVAARFAIAASYGDYRQMLEAHRPDGVIMCVGPEFHGRTASELMRLGYAVYTEKPPAIDLAQMRQVRAAQRETGQIYLTGFKKRYAPAYLKTKEIIESERFGAPATLSILRTSGAFGARADPRHHYNLESNIHVIDLATYLFGAVEKVSAFRQAPQNYAITLRFANGAVGALTLTDRLSYARGWEEVAVIGSRGVCIEIDNSVEMLAFEKDVPFAAHKPEFVAGSSHSSVEMGFTGELQAFVDAIAGGHNSAQGVEDSLHTMEVIDAIERSVEGGETVRCGEGAT